MEVYYNYIKKWIRNRSVTEKKEICDALMKHFGISKDEASQALQYYILGKV